MSNIVKVSLAQEHDFRFAIRFADDQPPFYGDEPPPLGQGTGPAPSQLLAAAVANCLSDSLLFALRKFKQQPEPLRAAVQAEVGRNAEGRLRILQITATLRLGVPASQLEHLDRVLGQFEAFCTVTQSVGQGIPITVKVVDSEDRVLK